jgi:hypothetical protein
VAGHRALRGIDQLQRLRGQRPGLVLARAGVVGVAGVAGVGEHAGVAVLLEGGGVGGAHRRGRMHMHRLRAPEGQQPLREGLQARIELERQFVTMVIHAPAEEEPGDGR